MLKKVYIIGLSILIVLSLAIPSFALSVDPPDGLTEAIIPWVPRYLYRLRSVANWYSRDTSPLMQEFYPEHGLLDDQIMFYPAIIFQDNTTGTGYNLKDFYTYYFEYEISTTDPDIDFWSYSTNSNNFICVHSWDSHAVFGDLSNSQNSSIGPEGLPLEAYGIESVMSVVPIGSGSYKVQFAFTTPYGIEAEEIVSLIFPSTGYLSEEGRVNITAFKSYADPAGTVYDEFQAQVAMANFQALAGLLESSSLTNEQLAQVNGQIAANQAILEEQSSMLQGDPNDYQDDSGFDSAAGELEDLEGQINDQITGNVTIDGESYEMNGALIGNFKEGFMDRWDPQDYEASAGREIARLFDLFYPYVGVAIFLNLTLAVILAFLRGRSNA